MATSKKQIVSLPLLICKNSISFPNNPQTIEAGRDISINAIKEAQANSDSLIFIVTQKSINIANPTPEDLFKVGTMCRIISVLEKNNILKIRVSPSDRVEFESFEFDEDKKCFFAKGTFLTYSRIDADKELKLRNAIMSKIEEAHDTIYDFLPRTFGNTIASKSIPTVVYTIAFNLRYALEKKQEILEESNIDELVNKCLEIIDGIKISQAVENSINEKIRKNSEQAQKEYFLREKMRAIKEELDENSGTDTSSIEKILEMVEKNPFPDYVKAKVKSEARRFEMMPQASLEASLIQNYIEILVDIPWYQKTTDNEDLKVVEKVLNEDHYGLDTVKKRIIEYLAVKKLTGNLKSPILCFFGPPGCGKTSLGKSIARALGRKFVKASLGGISDEAEIRGHRRTYVGSMPGRIIAGMRKAKTNNPVFLLDEIDKLASSYKGDPASAMLEVLDPEQNFAFNDNFIEEPVDLSDVLFICTANDLSKIPGPLRDRLELIEVNSYTEIEKTHIAYEHLIPKQTLANGLTPEQVTFSDDAIPYIIQHYTREAGVRDLERKIGGCLRKVAVSFVKKPNQEAILIDSKKVIKYLGTEIFENSKKEASEQIGVVTGLAYTEYGGDILPIEVNDFEGSGRLVITGNLGDVMKESCSIALDYVRANAKKYGIDPEIFKKNDIHIHVPEGAVPKDGPSAGVAITTAIISCLSKKPVDPNVAMTGEVTLRGFALPIGGLREKSLAALRSGIKTIIVPEENKKAVLELPDEVKKALKIVYMKNVDDAYKVAIIDK